ncbi:MAG: hypothetical protein JZU65_16100 [Chlorobium sp.]|nr:hypothetical protein [Chlorobium sp.]
MRKVTEAEIIAKQKAGKRLTTKDGKTFFPGRSVAPEKEGDVLSDIVGILKSNEANIAAIASIQDKMLTIIAGMVKPPNNNNQLGTDHAERTQG